MENKFIVSLSPHAHSHDSIERNMHGVIIALLPALFVSFLFFGIGAMIVCATSVASCVLCEWFISRFLLHRDGKSVLDGFAILTGILLGFNLPSNLPVWIVMIGAFIAIGIGKMTFGGLGCNIFNPALVGRAFLLVSFPVQMTTWPLPGQLGWSGYVDAHTGATPLALIKMAAKTGDMSWLEQLPDAAALLIGDSPAIGAGALGEVCSLALLTGLGFLLFRRIITWHIPVSILLSMMVFSEVFHLANPLYADPLTSVLSGGAMLGAIFMATDYVTSPMTPKGQLVYGVAIGFLTVIIRNFGAYPEGMSFAILMMNAFTPLINHYCKPRRFGQAV